MSDLLRWVIGRDKADLPEMERSEMMIPRPPARVTVAAKAAVWHEGCASKAIPPGRDRSKSRPLLKPEL